MSHFSPEHIVMYLNGRERPAVFILRLVKCIAEGEKEKIGLDPLCDCAYVFSDRYSLQT